MIRNLTYAQKNRLLIGCMIVLLFISWFLAFSKTIEAITQNIELRNSLSQRNDLSYNPELLRRRSDELNNIIKGFRVDPAEWPNDFWLKVSGIVPGKEIGIVYEPAVRTDQDTSRILKQEIRFLGDYRSLILLLDSIEKVNDIGRIGHLHIFKPKQITTGSDPEQLNLELKFNAVGGEADGR